MCLTIHCQFKENLQVLILRKRNLDQEALNIFKQWFHPAIRTWSIAFVPQRDSAWKLVRSSLKRLEMYWYIFTPWLYVIVHHTSYCSFLNIMAFCGQYDPVSGLYFVPIIGMENTYIYMLIYMFTFLHADVSSNNNKNNFKK